MRSAESDPGPPFTQPPLGISLSALILIGFMLMAAVGGISLVSRGETAAGALTIAVSAALVWVGWMLYRCHRMAWVAAICTFSFLTITWTIGAIVYRTPAAALYLPLFMAPIALLLLPGAREAVHPKRR